MLDETGVSSYNVVTEAYLEINRLKRDVEMKNEIIKDTNKDNAALIVIIWATVTWLSIVAVWY